MRRRKDTGEQLRLLFNLYEQKMYTIAYAVLHDEGQAEDAVMAAFEKLLRTPEVMADVRADHAKALIIRVIKQTSIDQYRKNARERAQVTSMESEATQAHVLAWEDVHAPDPAAATAEEIIADLPPAYRDVVHTRFVEDRTVAETAEELGLTEANVRKRQERALKMLRGNLGVAAAHLA